MRSPGSSGSKTGDKCSASGKGGVCDIGAAIAEEENEDEEDADAEVTADEEDDAASISREAAAATPD